MRIVDMCEEHEPLYFVCLKDWSEESREPGTLKARWYEQMRNRGLRVKLALDDRGEVGGMIEYVPIEYSHVLGSDLYFVDCIWVHGYEEGRGNFQGKGMGTALLAAAEEDVRGLGRKGLAAWGISAPDWMSASWYEKHGYEPVDSEGGCVLLWKPFSEDAAPPRWVRGSFEEELVPGKVTVTSLISGQCMSENSVHLSARRVAEEFSDKVAFRVIDTSHREVVQKCGARGGLYVDGVDVFTGMPPSYEELRKIVAEKVKELP